jgi:3-oxoacyl-[acyl-carrier protein] reductase
MKEFDLTKKVSLISGGTSGIGKEIAYNFAAHGSDIAIIGRNKEAGERIVKDIEIEYKVKAYFNPCDISDFYQVKESCKKIIKKYSKVDNIVLSAGYGSKKALEEMEIPEWERSVDININGPFYIVRCLISNMLAKGSGNIIIIGSATVLTGSGGGVHYSTTKVAQYGLMKGLSYEFLSRGIRTNIITPHIIDTPMLRKRYPDTPENNKMLASRVPIGRFGKPGDIANVALFLASDESSYICGTEIIADGGGVYYNH